MALTLDHWDRMSASEREAAAKRMVVDLPGGFAFDSVQDFRLGARQHHVALFAFGHAKFALIPAATASIGFDADRRWDPTPEELESWQNTAKEYGIDKSIQEYVVEITKRCRQVELGSFLVETVPYEFGWENVSLADPEVQDILQNHGNERSVEVSRGKVSWRVRWRDEGSFVAERSLAQTHAELAKELQTTGFRFPTSDEWEYLCGCGDPTLFRWGDHVPCDRYPTDTSPEEAAFRRQWVLSGGKLEYPPEGFAADWDIHRRPNAFGVSIASNPYQNELVAEIGITRGGDGGCTICGGAGFFIGWLTLATAYFEEHSCQHDPAEPVLIGYTYGRRMLSLR